MNPVPRILVIDDLEGIRLALIDFLESEGYECQAAVDGVEGLEKALAWKPDLVFLDVFMPGINGLEVIRRLRQQDTRTPVVIITAYDQDELARDLLVAGATDFIRKPWDFGYLKRMVESCLASRAT